VPGNAGGESETIIGRWLKRRGRRNDVVIMTKVGMWARHEGLRAANIEAAAEDFLRRLQTSYIDVYFAHMDDQTVPLDETLGAFSRLIEAGKVRTTGASNYGAGRLREAREKPAGALSRLTSMIADTEFCGRWIRCRLSCPPTRRRWRWRG
jgi:aryl-alcohol dehydrogenase-like predicted oxidoreductase